MTDRMPPTMLITNYTKKSQSSDTVFELACESKSRVNLGKAHEQGIWCYVCTLLAGLLPLSSLAKLPHLSFGTHV